MLFSLLVAFMVTPWASVRLLNREAEIAHGGEGWTTRLYRRAMSGLLHRPPVRYGFLGLVVFLLLASASLVAFRFVQVKMLPFDNKSEFQVVIDMPEGTTLEQTAAATRAIGDYVRTVPEVTNYEQYVGTASPYNFNGLVRHYFLRRGPGVADIQVRLALTLARLGDAAASLDLARTAETNGREHLRLMVRYLPERQALDYASSRPSALDLLIALVDVSRPASTMAMDAVVRNRALVLDEMANRHRGAYDAHDLQTAPLMATLTAARQRLANVVVRGPVPDRSSQYLALVESARLEKERLEGEFFIAAQDFAGPARERVAGAGDPRVEQHAQACAARVFQFSQVGNQLRVSVAKFRCQRILQFGRRQCVQRAVHRHHLHIAIRLRREFHH
jgi:hypothetical protein